MYGIGGNLPAGGPLEGSTLGLASGLALTGATCLTLASFGSSSLPFSVVLFSSTGTEEFSLIVSETSALLFSVTGFVSAAGALDGAATLLRLLVSDGAAKRVGFLKVSSVCGSVLCTSLFLSSPPFSAAEHLSVSIAEFNSSSVFLTHTSDVGEVAMFIGCDCEFRPGFLSLDENSLKQLIKNMNHKYKYMKTD